MSRPSRGLPAIIPATHRPSAARNQLQSSSRNHFTAGHPSVGTPYTAGGTRAVPALLTMPPLTLLGAALAREQVESTVGQRVPVTDTVALDLVLGRAALRF